MVRPVDELTATHQPLDRPLQFATEFFREPKPLGNDTWLDGPIFRSTNELKNCLFEFLVVHDEGQGFGIRDENSVERLQEASDENCRLGPTR